MLSGDGGQGKSLLAQQLLTAAAGGRDWLGFRTRQVRTWGMFCEDPISELQIRQAAINEHYELGMGDLAESLMLECRLDKDSYLCSFERWTDKMTPTGLWANVVSSVKRFGAQLVLLDTARKTFGGNEISDKQVSRYICMLRRLAIQIGGAVVITLHPSNEGIASGSGITGNRAWRNEVRAMMYLTDAGKDADSKPNARLLRVKKANYAAGNGKISLRWDQGVLKRDDLPAARLPFDDPPF